MCQDSPQNLAVRAAAPPRLPASGAKTPCCRLQLSRASSKDPPWTRPCTKDSASRSSCRGSRGSSWARLRPWRRKPACGLPVHAWTMLAPAQLGTLPWAATALVSCAFVAGSVAVPELVHGQQLSQEDDYDKAYERQLPLRTSWCAADQPSPITAATMADALQAKINTVVSMRHAVWGRPRRPLLQS